MRFLTDENTPRMVTELLRDLGHDAVDVREVRMAGASDQSVSDFARREQRMLITQDLDFANILHYPPSEYAGIIVLRVPMPTQRRVADTLRDFLAVADLTALSGALVIVEPGSYRVRRS